MKALSTLTFLCSETENSYLQISGTLMRFGNIVGLHFTIGPMVAHFSLRNFPSGYSIVLRQWPPRYPDLRHFNYTVTILQRPPNEGPDTSQHSDL
jgi:hypothetical protein